MKWISRFSALMFGLLTLGVIKDFFDKNRILVINNDSDDFEFDESNKIHVDSLKPENYDNAIDMRGKKKEQVSEMLFSSGYKKIDDDDGYKYLVKMPMDMVTAENVDQLNDEKNKKIAELELLEKTSEKQIWLSELVEMKNQYTEYKKERSNDGAVVVKKKLIVKKTKVVSNV